MINISQYIEYSNKWYGINLVTMIFQVLSGSSHMEQVLPNPGLCFKLPFCKKMKWFIDRNNCQETISATRCRNR